MAYVPELPLAEAALEVFRFVGTSPVFRRFSTSIAGNTYEDKIRFPTLVELVSGLEHGGERKPKFLSGSRKPGNWIASKVAAYGKLGRLPAIPLSCFPVRTGLHFLRELFPHKPSAGQAPASLRSCARLSWTAKRSRWPSD